MMGHTYLIFFFLPISEVFVAVSGFRPTHLAGSVKPTVGHNPTIGRELKKGINPDTKHTFTTYSLVFTKESNLSSKLVPVQELVSPVNVRMPID
jgi:hypothetical protein